MISSARFLLVSVMMFATAVMLHVRGDVDKVLPSRPLTELPETFGSRVALDIPLDDEVLAVLGKGFFLNRVYRPLTVAPGTRLGDQIPVGLFIGYFPTQRTGQAIHSPQNCLPGAGWVFQSSGLTDLHDPSGKKYEVGEYIISDGRAQQEVLYWYQLHGRSIASDYKAKVYTLADSIRYGRTDEALVRVTTEIAPGEDRGEAHNRAVGFANQIVPLLPAYIPN